MNENGPEPQEQPLPKRRRRTLDQRLNAARLKESAAAARLARKSKQVEKYEALSKTRERKLETRRKIIAGALALESCRHDAEWGTYFRGLLDRYVEKEAERLLFGLPPLPNPGQAPMSPAGEAIPAAPAPASVAATEATPEPKATHRRIRWPGHL